MRAILAYTEGGRTTMFNTDHIIAIAMNKNGQYQIYDNKNGLSNFERIEWVESVDQLILDKITFSEDQQF